MTEERCIFCEIISGAIPASIVYNDSTTIAFLDIAPVNKGQVLVVPKEHSRNILDATDMTLSSLMPIVKKISIGIKKAIGAEGINIHMNNEPVAGQSVFHTHIHVIPRFREDGITMWKGHPYPEEEMEKMKEKIQSVFL